MDTPAVSRRTALAGLGALGVAAAAPVASANAAPGRKALIGKAMRGELHVMSFNIRYDTGKTKPGEADYWADRAPILTQFLKLEQPTILGIQEGLYHQLAAVEAALPTHKMIGYGRDGGSNGEYSSIFYDPARVSVLEWDQFWLSDTPDLIASKTWGNNVTRIVTWARMVDRATNKGVRVHQHALRPPVRARPHQERRGHGHSRQDLREAPDDHHRRLQLRRPQERRLRHPRRLRRLQGHVGPHLPQAHQGFGTFPGYKDPVVGGDRIDWVLASPSVTILEAAISMFRVRGRYPSDHAPVHALVRLP